MPFLLCQCVWSWSCGYGVLWAHLTVWQVQMSQWKMARRAMVLYPIQLETPLSFTLSGQHLLALCCWLWAYGGSQGHPIWVIKSDHDFWKNVRSCWRGPRRNGQTIPGMSFATALELRFWTDVLFAPLHFRTWMVGEGHGFCILDVGVSENWDTPKWMVKIMENLIQMDDFWGKTHYFRKHPYGMWKTWLVIMENQTWGKGQTVLDAARVNRKGQVWNQAK